MKKFICLLCIVALGCLNMFPQFERVQELGSFEDVDGSPLYFYLVTDAGKPKYVEFPTMEGYKPCYLPINEIGKFNNYLKEIINVIEPWNEEAIETVPETDDKKIEIESPEVFMSWYGSYKFNQDEKFEGMNRLDATWEFYRNIRNMAGSYVLFSTIVNIKENTDEIGKFKLRVPLDTLKWLQKKLLTKSNIMAWANNYSNGQRHNKTKLNNLK